MATSTPSIVAAGREHGNTPALVCCGRTLSWAELAHEVGRAAGWLDCHGVTAGGGQRVAIVPRLDLESVVLLHALVALGVTIVPIHPRLQPAERAALVSDCSPSLTIDDPKSLASEIARRRPLAEWPAEPAPDAPLAILYTSGSTGKPKGAMLSRRAFHAAAAASAANLGWQANDRWLLCMPLAHVGGLSILIRCLLARRAVVLSSLAQGFGPEAVHADVTAASVTLLSLVPTMLRRMLDEPRTATLPPSVRAVLLGGAAAPPSLVEEAAHRRLPVLTTYGLTEACSQVTTQRYGTRPSAAQGSGEPVQGMHVRIAGDQRIELRGDSMMTGYLPAHTHVNAFLPDGWFRTEDLGRMDDEGRLHVLGRTQELVVTGGENVYPLEVETALEQTEGVRAICVFGVPDATWGELVCAAVVADDAGVIARLDAHARATLAAHKRPRRYALLERLSIGPTGKIDRRATAERASRELRDPT